MATGQKYEDNIARRVIFARERKNFKKQKKIKYKLMKKKLPTEGKG